MFSLWCRYVFHVYTVCRALLHSNERRHASVVLVIVRLLGLAASRLASDGDVGIAARVLDADRLVSVATGARAERAVAELAGVAPHLVVHHLRVLLEVALLLEDLHALGADPDAPTSALLVAQFRQRRLSYSAFRCLAFRFRFLFCVFRCIRRFSLFNDDLQSIDKWFYTHWYCLAFTARLGLNIASRRVRCKMCSVSFDCTIFIISTQRLHVITAMFYQVNHGIEGDWEHRMHCQYKETQLGISGHGRRKQHRVHVLLTVTCTCTQYVCMQNTMQATDPKHSRFSPALRLVFLSIHVM